MSLSQFFSILSDLRCYIGVPSQALQIIFDMQSQKKQLKKELYQKNKHFFKLQNVFFFSHFSSF